MESDKIACYTFLPWTRKGVAAEIKEKESFGGPSSSDRASIDVDVLVKRKSINGQTDEMPVPKTVRLFGPGDIIGIDKRTIVRTEPRQGSTDFEPNYLVYAEFHEEDYIWRYSPASPAGPGDKRLRPWLALIVLKEDGEFNFQNFNPLTQPLPSIEIVGDRATIFPEDDQYWAWGHVHINRLLSESEEYNEGGALQQVVDANPNVACSRLMSPRRLDPNTRYHAFIVPAYEKGRLAGIGADSDVIDAVPSQQFSWAVELSKMPFYHHWSFRTGDQGDFEALVRRLEPKILDERVGRRLMDIQRPGYALSYDGDDELKTEGHKGAIYLEGALRAPQNETVNFIKSDDSESTVKQLGDVLNLDDDLRKDSLPPEQSFTHHPHFVNGNTPSSIVDDPIITPPIYGKWHNLVSRVDTDKSKANRWINHLNLDPRQRTAAGFGTQVIQKNQEAYMDRAWNQFGDILEANRRLIQAQYVERFSKNLYKKRIQKLSDQRFLQDTFSIHSRVKLDSKMSVSKFIGESRMPDTTLSGEYVKMTRPNGPVKSFLKNSQKDLDDQIVDELAIGKLAAAPRYEELSVDADGRLDQFKQAFNVGRNIAVGGINKRKILLANFGVKKGVAETISRFNSPALGGTFPRGVDPKKPGPIGKPAPGPIGKPTPGAIGKPTPGPIGKPTPGPIGKPTPGPIGKPTPEPIDPIINKPGGPIIVPDLDLGEVTIEPVIEVIFIDDKPVVQTGVKESLGISFGSIDKNVFELSQSTYTEYLTESNWSSQAPKPKLSVKSVSNELRTKLDPERTYTSRILNRLQLGDKIQSVKPKKIKPILVAPEFCDAMYRELVNISTELFLPNLNLIKNNSISVLETNPEFIESYLVGLNHEFSRELHWREYLTDQRGSYFRQFWDTYSKSNDEGLKPADFEEAKKDIKPIHTWGSARLGNNQPSNQKSGDKTVLTIRGDLLKKYPNTIIFMQEAEFENPSNPDLSKPRVLKDGGKIITPSFEAKIDPDIYFIGFDISVVDARGDKEAKKPGYFFVLQERTGEIHFGMDTELTKSTIVPSDQIIKQVFSNGVTLEKPSVLLKRIQGELRADTSWNDLAWEDIPGNSSHIDLSNSPKNPNREGLQWGDDAATMASILYQNPFMMAIHASEMISKDAN